MEAFEARSNAPLYPLVSSVGRYCRRASSRDVRHSRARICVTLSRPRTYGSRRHDTGFTGSDDSIMCTVKPLLTDTSE